MEIKDKLDIFTKMVMDDAQAHKKTIQQEIDAEFDKACEDITAHTKRDEEARFKSEKFKAEQMRNKNTIASNTEAKKSLIDLRNSFLDKIFESVTHKIRDYTSSPDYEKYLLNEIQKTCEGKNDVKLYLTPKDMRFASSIEQKTGIKPQASSDDALGGFRAILGEQRMVVDNTFAVKLQDAKVSYSAFKLSE